MKLSTLMGLINATYSEFNSVGFNDSDNNHVPQHTSGDYIAFLKALIEIVKNNVDKENA